jgi:hypothetical protein
MKNEMTLFIVIVGLIAVASIGVWYLNRMGSDQFTLTLPLASTTTAPSAPAKSTSGTKAATKSTVPVPVANIKLSSVDSIVHLLTLKDNNYSCSFTTVSPSPYHSGTLYLSGTKARANLANAVDMIDDGVYVYAWKSSGGNGLRVLANVSSGGSVVSSYGGVDPWSQVNVKCSPWTPDPAKFAPPVTVPFYNGADIKVQ